jgi:hypothetical protein
VDDRSKSSSTYDMIIRRYILAELGMILNFQDKTVSWDTDTIPMRENGNLKTLKLPTEVYLTEYETKTIGR